VPATAAQNFISAARQSGARPRRNDPEKTSVVNGTCAACSAGGAEKNGILWWF
jgi:hypothetical protein